MASVQIPVNLTPTPEAIPASLAPILRGEKGDKGDPGDAGSGSGANLSYTASPTGGTVTSDTGTDATLPLADGTNAGLMAPAQHSKLAGLPSSADAAGTASAAMSAHTGAADPHTQYVLESTVGAAGGVASLDGAGQVPAAQIPAIAITELLGTVASQSAMLALSGQKGDWCIRTDTGTTWIITGTNPALLAGWTELVYPAAPVSSVAGRTGAVTLTSSDLTDTTAAGRALLDDVDAAAQRATLGLGDAAAKNTGTTAGTVAAGDDARLSDARTPTSHTHALADLTQSSASTGQVPTWNGTAWAPATPSAGGGSSNTRWIGAGELVPRVTNGAGIDGEELATNKINIDYLAFDAGTAEYAQATFDWPSGFTTFTAKFFWTAASGSGAVVWAAQARCYADDDALDQAQGTAQTVTDTLLAANDTHISSATSAITPGGTVATGNLCVVQVYRDATNGSDTLAVDARLIGIRLEFSA